jgi:hypothetical protein
MRGRQARGGSHVADAELRRRQDHFATNPILSIGMAISDPWNSVIREVQPVASVQGPGQVCMLV